MRADAFSDLLNTIGLNAVCLDTARRAWNDFMCIKKTENMG